MSLGLLHGVCFSRSQTNEERTVAEISYRLSVRGGLGDVRARVIFIVARVWDSTRGISEIKVRELFLHDSYGGNQVACVCAEDMPAEYFAICICQEFDAAEGLIIGDGAI